MRGHTQSPATRGKLYEQLELAIKQAEEVNASSVGDISAARLLASLQCIPAAHDSGARKILQLYQSGHVVSVDLASLEITQAIRLTDFCSGVAAASAGWVFRTSTYAFMLVPNAGRGP